MDIKFICKECGREIKEKSNFCPHCGKELEMVETTYKISVEIVFTEKPKNCCGCRFSKDEIDGYCLLNPDIIFKNYHKNKYYGFYGDKNEKCPIIL
jgi:hypothetical protein